MNCCFKLVFNLLVQVVKYFKNLFQIFDFSLVCLTDHAYYDRSQIFVTTKPALLKNYIPQQKTQQ